MSEREYKGSVQFIETRKLGLLSLLVESVSNPSGGSASNLKLEVIAGKVMLGNDSLDALGSIYEEKPGDEKIGFSCDLPPQEGCAAVMIFSGGQYAPSKYSGIFYEQITLADGSSKKGKQGTFKIELTK